MNGIPSVIAKGLKEDILDILEDKCQLPADLRSRIEDEKNLQTLTRWLKLAAKADSLEEFLSQM
ncbi:MAG: hypothetical protein SOX85_02940 [Lachnospiraceae bacterium]|nr:hypothetical protein [Lachnospiraceae bacterium]MDY4206442.1 hypothetical protein [Lachnospiraceae bacterium]